MGDWEEVKKMLRLAGYEDDEPCFADLSRLEAEHARVVEENKRLRADAERLAGIRAYCEQVEKWTDVAVLKLLVMVGKP